MLNRNQLLDKIGELQAIIYWHVKGSFKHANIEDVREELKGLEADLANCEFEPEINKRGNHIDRGFRYNIDRYYFDFKACHSSKGWEQYDTNQDASYFGIWINRDKRQILTYAEGDITLVTCPTVEGFIKEIKSMNEFYGEAPPAFRCISRDGKITHIFTDKFREV